MYEGIVIDLKSFTHLFNGNIYLKTLEAFFISWNESEIEI